MTFNDFLREHGLVPRTVAADGKWRRCATESHPKKRNGAYCLAADGEVGWLQDWAVHTQPITWRPEREAGAVVAPPRPVDHAALRQRQEQERVERERAIAGARDFYAGCAPLLGGHPYLAAHGLGMEGCLGLRIDSKGWLVIPAFRGRELMTVQRISPEGEKLFWKGAPVAGASYTVHRPSASITVLVEGLATGLAIFAAAPLTRIVVAFNSGNLGRVAERVPRWGMAVVAGDNDHRTVCQAHRREGLTVPFTPWEERPEWCICNPGRCAAVEVAAELGCGVALPEGIQGTDWSDYRVERVAERLARPAYGRRAETETGARRAVDAEIAAAITRGARLLRDDEVA